MYRVKEVLNIADFNKILEKYPDLVIPIEQTPVWSNYENEINGRKSLGFFVYFEGDTPVALAHPFKYDARLRSYLWMKFGPVWLIKPTQQQERMLVETLINQFKKTEKPQPLFVRMQLQHDVKAAREPFEHNMYDATIIVNLEPDVDKIFASFKNGARRNYKIALKSNLEFKKYTGQEAAAMMRDGLHDLMAETGSRAGFRVHPSRVYETMLRTMPDNAMLYVTSLDGEATCWSLCTLFGNQARYYFSANNMKSRDSRATYYNLWNLMQDMKALGAHEIDLMGIASENYPELKSVTEFKKSFTKEDPVVIPSTYDIPLSEAKYRAVATMLTGYRAVNNLRTLNTKRRSG